MLSFHVKFVQTDGQTDEQTDNGKIICPPNLSIRGHKKEKFFVTSNLSFSHHVFHPI